ncbi:MAG: hypothetical protein IPL65_03995 [Lewinellaceae bacterium]|nr:hypothetical protein [Lewinellaceae bacterium]
MLKKSTFWLILVFGNSVLLAQSIRYEIEPMHQTTESLLDVHAYFKGDQDGITAVSIPAVFGHQRQLQQCIRQFECLTPGVQMQRPPDSPIVLIAHQRGEELILHYQVVQDFEGNAPSFEQALRPVVQDNWFELIGATLFVIPKDWHSFDVQVQWHQIPEHWRLVNSYGVDQMTQQFSANSKRWLESVFAGGDFRVLSGTSQGQSLLLGIRSEGWPAADEDLLQTLLNIRQVQQAYWEEPEDGQPPFTVVVSPLAEVDTTTFHCLGLGLHHAFTAFATPNSALRMQALQHLFQHEMLHEWVGNRIRCGRTPGDMRSGWFSEGFTEYLAYQNMLMAGQIDPDAYLEAINKDFFENLYNSPIGSCSNQTLNEQFFVDANYRQLTYWRGFVLAFYLDNRIKEASHSMKSLRNWMLELQGYYGADPQKSLVSHPDFFQESLSELVGADMDKWLYEHVQQGKLIPETAFVLPANLTLIKASSGFPQFNLNKTVVQWEKMLLW